VIFLSVPVSKLYERIHPPAGYQSFPLGKADYVFNHSGRVAYPLDIGDDLR